MEPKQAYEILKSKANLEDNVKQALLEVIKTDPKYAYVYAKNVIEGRWKEAEEYIKTNAHWAYFYARYVIKGRFPEAEPYIKNKPPVTLKREYDNYFNEPRWDNPCAYSYARWVIEGRFPEAEEYIKTDPRWAYYYALHVIKGRFPEAEDTIKNAVSLMDDGGYAKVFSRDVASWYAEYVIKDENFWENQEALEEFMNNVPKPKPNNNELDALKKQREELDNERKELDNKIKQLECA